MKNTVKLTILEVENRNIPTFIGGAIPIAASGSSSSSSSCTCTDDGGPKWQETDPIDHFDDQ